MRDRGLSLSVRPRMQAWAASNTTLTWPIRPWDTRSRSRKKRRRRLRRRKTPLMRKVALIRLRRKRLFQRSSLLQFRRRVLCRLPTHRSFTCLNLRRCRVRPGRQNWLDRCHPDLPVFPGHRSYLFPNHRAERTIPPKGGPVRLPADRSAMNRLVLIQAGKACWAGHDRRERRVGHGFQRAA